MKNLIFTIQSASWRIINQLLFGISCFNCGKPGSYICKKCLDTIKLSDSTEYPGIYGLYDYGSPLISHSIWNLKYKHKGQEARLLLKKASVMVTEIIAEHLQSESIQEIIFVPVPQYKRRFIPEVLTKVKFWQSGFQKKYPTLL
jgi:predicted amidophosphoribosyltransferase